MSREFRISPFFLVVLLPLFTVACGNQAMGPSEPLPENSLLISGALNTRFESPMVVASVRSHEDLKILQVLIKMESNFDEQKELAQVMVTFPFRSENNVPDEGSYTFVAGDVFEPGHFDGSLEYRLREGSCCDDRCSFTCTSMNLQIDYSQGNLMRGKFSVMGDQAGGMRIRNGLVEDLILGMDGEVMISGKFDLEVKVN